MPHSVGNALIEELALEIILRKGEDYGQGIRDELLKRYNIKIGNATIYNYLHSLRDDGYLETVDGIDRTLYRVADETEAKKRLASKRHELLQLTEGWIDPEVGETEESIVLKNS